MTWLDEVEKAFAANLINDNRKIAIVVPHLKGFRSTFISHFHTLTLEGKWFAQLATRKQQLNEDVDAYYTSIQKLLRQVESGGHQYPETAKSQIFLNAVAPSTPNTLQATYERANSYESACRQSLPYLPTSLSALYLAYSTRSSFIRIQPPVLTSESAIEKLTEALNLPPVQASANPPFHSPPPIPVNLGPNDAPENWQQEILQALLALAASLNPARGQNNHHTYVSIFAEDVPLFVAAKQDLQRLIQPSRDCQRREILVPPPNLDNLPPLVYYDPDSDSSSEDEWYSYQDFSTSKVKTDDFDSDANDEIDEENRRPKIKKGKNKPVNVKCYYDEVKNAYLKEETIKPDPRGGIVDAPAIESPL
ncbi:13696_t:CDS:2, partial [Racocetra fulgida]